MKTMQDKWTKQSKYRFIHFYNNKIKNKEGYICTLICIIALFIILVYNISLKTRYDFHNMINIDSYTIETVDAEIEDIIAKEKEIKYESDEQLLRQIYLHVLNNINYKTKYVDESAFKDNSEWYKAFAYDAIKNHEGSCYYYASTFAMFAKKLGYEDVYIIRGTVKKVGDEEPTLHCWVEINGYIYDPAFDSNPKVGITDKDIEFFKVNEQTYRGRGDSLEEWERIKVKSPPTT